MNGMSDTAGTTGGLLGALAQGLRGGIGSSMLRNAVGNTTQAGLAAQPDTLAAYASPQGGINYAAQNPGMNKLSLAQILAGGNPTSGQTEGIGGINLRNYRIANQLDPATGQPMPGAVAPMIPSLLGSPSVGTGANRMAPPATGFPQSYSGHAQPAAEAAPTVGALIDQTISRLAAATTPQARQAILATLPPDQIIALKARLGGVAPSAP
jgi:hypothetical protein